jgi:HEAT repeat protein
MRAEVAMRRGIPIVLCALLFAAPASAQRGRAEVTQAITNLSSRDPAEVRAAIEALGVAGDARAVGPISERIRKGLPPDLLDAAIDALTVLGRPEAGPVLFELANHRRAAVRLKAVIAIAATHPRGADRVLAEALGDTNAQVRSAAAEGLGEISATSAIDALFHALDRRILEAAASLGRLVRATDIERFLGYLGQLPFDAITPALTEMLRREDLPARARLTIVHRLIELATPEVRTFLEQYVASLPESDRSELRRAAEDAIPRLGQ